MYFSDADLAAIIACHPNKAVATSGVTPVNGIFITPGKSVNLFDGSVNSSEPQFVIRRSDAVTLGIDIGSTLTILSVAYSVIDTDERNDGMVALPLTKGA